MNTREEMLQKAVQTKHPISIHFLEDDGHGYYFAFLPDFGYSACSATGDTVEEALENLRSVKAAVIQHYIDTGREIPQATSCPTEGVELQQMPLRVPRDLHERLKEMSHLESMSLNAYVQRVLIEHMTLRTVERKLETLMRQLLMARLQSLPKQSNISEPIPLGTLAEIHQSRLQLQVLPGEYRPYAGVWEGSSSHPGELN